MRKDAGAGLNSANKAYLNAVETAVPPHDVHRKFVEYAPSLIADDRERRLFERMAQRCQIEHRYAFFQPEDSPQLLDTGGFFQRGAFPTTQARMAFYEAHAFGLARQALDRLDLAGVTHVIVTSCTGFYAPGLDFEIARHYGMAPTVERTMIGFMGCFAAINALKLARHIVRSEARARVAILNLELCTLHLQERGTLEEMLSFLIFADGCAASIVSAEPSGLELQGFATAILPESDDQITWRIGDAGFAMNLSGKVPNTVAARLPQALPAILGGRDVTKIDHWAVHPGGRSILDAVREGAGLGPDALEISRDVLRDYGNMSSASVMFVLKAVMARIRPGQTGCGMAFGPGVTVESLRFAG